MSRYKEDEIPKWVIPTAITGATVLGGCAALSQLFRIAGAGRRIVVTGWGIKNGPRVCESALNIPFFRQVVSVSVQPNMHHVRVVTLLRNNLHVIFPVAVSVAPDFRKALEKTDEIKAWKNKQKRIEAIIRKRTEIKHDHDGVDQSKHETHEIDETHNNHSDDDFTIPNYMRKDGLQLFVENFSHSTKTLVPDPETGRMLDLDLQSAAVTANVCNVVRKLLATLTFPELQQNRVAYTNIIQDLLNVELEKLGLIAVTCGIEKLTDVDKHDFLANLETQALQEAKRKADIATSDAETATRIALAKNNEKATSAECDANALMASANATLNEKKIGYDKQVQMAKLKADAETKQEEMNLQKQVEIKRAEQQVEAIRAKDLSEAKVKADVLNQITKGQAEALLAKTTAEVDADQRKATTAKQVTILEAEGKARAVELESAADLIAAKNQYEARVLEAEAEKRKAEAKKDEMRILSEGIFLQAQNEAMATKERAGAALFEAEKEAAGILAKGQADAKQYADHVSAAGGADAFTQFHFTKTQQAQKVAHEIALGIQKAKPKFTVLQSGDNVAGALASIVGAVPNVLGSLRQLWPISISTNGKLSEEILKK